MALNDNKGERLLLVRKHLRGARAACEGRGALVWKLCLLAPVYRDVRVNTDSACVVRWLQSRCCPPDQTLVEVEKLEIESSSRLGVRHDRGRVHTAVGPAGMEQGIEMGVEGHRRNSDRRGEQAK